MSQITKVGEYRCNNAAGHHNYAFKPDREIACTFLQFRGKYMYGYIYIVTCISHSGPASYTSHAVIHFSINTVFILNSGM